MSISQTHGLRHFFKIFEKRESSSKKGKFDQIVLIRSFLLLGKLVYFEMVIYSKQSNIFGCYVTFPNYVFYFSGLKSVISGALNGRVLKPSRSAEETDRP